MSTDQPLLFQDFPDDEPALVAAFREYHARNPRVYKLVDRFTREALAAGRDRLGIGLIFERIRWYTQVETTGDTFKVNNNFRAFYARLWMRNNPWAGEVFATRRSQADEGEAA